MPGPRARAGLRIGRNPFDREPGETSQRRCALCSHQPAQTVAHAHGTVPDSSVMWRLAFGERVLYRHNV